MIRCSTCRYWAGPPPKKLEHPRSETFRMCVIMSEYNSPVVSERPVYTEAEFSCSWHDWIEWMVVAQATE